MRMSTRPHVSMAVFTMAAPAVVQATQGYREEMDIMADFLTDRCIIAPGATASAKELYAAYTSWAEAIGEKRPLSQTALGIALTERGFERRRGTGGRFVWHGVGVSSE